MPCTPSTPHPSLCHQNFLAGQRSLQITDTLGAIWRESYFSWGICFFSPGVLEKVKREVSVDGRPAPAARAASSIFRWRAQHTSVLHTWLVSVIHCKLRCWGSEAPTWAGVLAVWPRTSAASQRAWAPASPVQWSNWIYAEVWEDSVAQYLQNAWHVVST